MQFLQIISAVALAGFAVAFPTNPQPSNTPSNTPNSSGGFSSDDGFPNPSDAQLALIEKIADGQLSNAPPPPKLAPSSLTAFQLIAFNENFEVAFFSSLINNITRGIDGFNVQGSSKQELLDVLKTVLAQEELHAINAINVLNNFKAFAPSPCIYKFPTTDVRSAITLAETFTALVLGTLQDAAQLLATNGDAGPVRGVASVIGNEGEQNGFYRQLLGFKPSEKPFLTTSVAPFAFSALQDFIVSCPFDQTDKNLINITIFPTIKVLTGDGGSNVSPQDQMLEFSADLAKAPAENGSWEQYRNGNGEGLFVTYFTGQNLPISVPVLKATFDGSVITFKANFPFEENVMDGLSVASLTTRGGFTNPDDVPAATLAAPGLIQVNDKL